MTLLKPAPGEAHRAPALSTRLPDWAPWAALALLAFYAYGMGFIWGHYMFLDLRVYMGAAHKLLFGQDPYNYSFTFVHLYATYPPFALMVLSPLSLVPVRLLVYLWSLLNLACLAWLFSAALAELRPGLLARRPRDKYLWPALMALAAAIAIQPVRADFGFGQINILLITLVVADVLHRGRRGRGLAVGIAAAIKLTPLIFVLLLFLDGDRRAAARSVAAFFAATVGAWLVSPQLSVQYFLHFSVIDQRIGAPSYVSNQSLNGILARLGLPGPVAGFAWVLGSLVIVAVSARAARRLLRPEHSAFFPLLLMATTGLLVSPVSWDHHWSWVALFPFALLDRSLWPAARSWLVAVVAVAVAAPYWWWGTPTSYGIPTGFAGPILDDSLALVGLAFVVAVAWGVEKRPALWAGRAARWQGLGGGLEASGPSGAPAPEPSLGGACADASSGRGGQGGARTRALRRYRPWTRQNGVR